MAKTVSKVTTHITAFFDYESFDSSDHFFHLCSEGTSSDVLFHDQKEFIEGMNILALAMLKKQVDLLAFCLMDNHFHFIIYGNKGHACDFALYISQFYMTRRHLWKVPKIIGPIQWGLHHIDNEDYLKRSITYVLRNPSLISKEELTLDYPWSSGILYFRGKKVMKMLTSCLKPTNQKPYHLRKILKSQLPLPENWLITPSGYIWPGSYVNYQLVEQIFKNKRSFEYHMVSRQEEELAKMEIFQSRATVTDIELREHAKEISQELYGHENLLTLNLHKRITVAKKLMLTYHCSEKQLYKILHLEQMQR